MGTELDRALDASFEHSGLNSEPLKSGDGNPGIRTGIIIENRVDGITVPSGTLIKSRTDGADFEHSPDLNGPPLGGVRG